MADNVAHPEPHPFQNVQLRYFIPVPLFWVEKRCSLFGVGLSECGKYSRIEYSSTTLKRMPLNP